MKNLKNLNSKDTKRLQRNSLGYTDHKHQPEMENMSIFLINLQNKKQEKDLINRPSLKQDRWNVSS